MTESALDYLTSVGGITTHRMIIKRLQELFPDAATSTLRASVHQMERDGTAQSVWYPDGLVWRIASMAV